MQVKANNKLQANHSESKTGETPHSRPAKSKATVKAIKSNALDTLRAEKTPGESGEKYQALLETSTDIILTHDITGQITYVNPSGLKITEYSEADLIGSNIATILPSEELAAMKKRASARRRGEVGTYEYETKFISKSGRQVCVEVHSAPIIKAGQSVEFLINARDITERKRTEEKIERQNQRLKTLREIDTAILASDSVESIIGAALSHIRELIDCHRAGMALIDWEANEAVIFNVKTAGETSVAKGSRVPLTLLQAMPQAMSKPLANNQPVLIHDLTEEPDLPPLLQVLRSEGLRSVCILPLFSQGSQMGTFNLLSEIPGFFDEEKIGLGREVANQMAIAITQSRLVESMRESEERFSTAFHSSPNAIAISRVADGQFIDANNAACHLFGYSREELIGHRSLDLGLTNAETRQKIINVLKTQGKIQDFEITISARGGIQRDILESMETIRVSGEQCILTNMIDITERKRAEEALRKSEERYRTVADYTYDWEYWRAPDGRILYIAPSCERVTGYRAEEFIANPGLLEAIMHPDDRFLLEQHKSLTQQDGKYPGVHKMEYRIIRKDGEIRWIGHLCQLICRDDGTSLGRRATNRDITENRLAEEEIRRLNIELEERVIQRTAQLETANKELESFAYSVSHDLRAPLRAITGYTNILLEDYEPSFDPEGKRVCGVINSEAQRMGKLIDDLLTFSRLSRTEMHNSKIDMQVMAQSVFDELTTPESRERIDFRIGELPAATGDPGLIRQVWINLLANATKFTSRKERAVIQVEGTQGDGEIVYFVRDNGAGFDMRYVDKLFGVFQRLHSEREFEGTGVGLAIVQRVIFRHGGRVWGEGQVDHGAVFFFALPRKEEPHE